MKTNILCSTKPLNNEGDLTNAYVPFKNLLKAQVDDYGNPIGNKILDF
jgi:hypothetical protein